MTTISIETAQQLGLRLKSLRALLEKVSPRPLSLIEIAKAKNWEVADVAILVELGVASELITEKYVGDEPCYTMWNQKIT